MTEFVILYREGEGPWKEAAQRVEAGGQRSAKEQFVQSAEGEMLEVVACPARSWQPEKFSAKVERKVQRVTAPAPAEPTS